MMLDPAPVDFTGCQVESLVSRTSLNLDEWVREPWPHTHFWGFGEEDVIQTFESRGWAHREGGCSHVKLTPTPAILIPGAGVGGCWGSRLAVKGPVGETAILTLRLLALNLGFGTVTVPDAGFRAHLSEFFLCKTGMTNTILVASLWWLHEGTGLSVWHRRGGSVKISFPVLKRNQKSTQTPGSAHLDCWHLAFSQGRRGPERLLLLLPLFVP